MKEITIIGVGLIGGSFALDIQAVYPEARIKGIDSNPDHMKKAIELGVVHTQGTYAHLAQDDLVVIAVPVDTAINVLPAVLEPIGEDTLVIDMGSTKEGICAFAKAHPRRRNFLACHPIAGTEFSGPEAAIKKLYEGKTNIICEVEKTAFKLQEKGLDLFKKLGMRIRYMDPVSHDKHIAYVSHLSHISSFMLGKTVMEKEKNERDIFDMAGSGFASTVRLAKSNPATWTAIFKDNENNIIETLDEYIANLELFKEHMKTKNYDAVFNVMKDSNRIKQILKGID